MADFSQAGRPLTIDTPLGKDLVLIRGFTGHEGISQLFRFELDLIAKIETDVAFDKLLNQKVTVHLVLRDGNKRHFNGVCVRISQGEQEVSEDKSRFTAYRMELVPEFWRLTRVAQSRIFQQKSVPDILKEVLVGFKPNFDLKGTFDKRDYCVQYRETDFNFACRLMEEEGIYYFFKHSDGDHQMVVANTPSTHNDLTPGPSEFIYENVAGGLKDEDRIYDWEKVQELRSGKYTLWDHSFELPDQNLEAQKTIQDTAKIGTVEHKLKVGSNDKFEVYDFPGEYAQRYDGVDPGGGDRSSDVSKIFQDNKRTVELRMQEEALASLVVQGSSNCRNLSTGQRFKLKRHFSADGGPYVLTGIQHSAQGSGDFLAGRTAAFEYHNAFTCIPCDLPFRPPRLTPKPVVHGTQTAIVVGPDGEEIFTDKYARVKVQFFWDRQGKKDENSSCWIRVATTWAGKQWGTIYIPRIGMEVIVDFLEGDPDQPIIIGCVYNADFMPPTKLPSQKAFSGLKTRSTLKGTGDNANAIEFDDTKGSEGLYIHSEKNQYIQVENDDDYHVGHDRKKTVEHDETTRIKNNRTVNVDADEKLTVGNSRTVTVNQSDDTHHVKQGKREVTIDMGDDNLKIKMGNQTTKIDLGKSETEAMQSIELKVGQSSVKIDQMGVTIKGMMITIEAQLMNNVKGMMTTVEGQLTTDVKGMMTTTSGDVMMTSKGMLNMVTADGMLMAHGAITMIG
jgi:type VI secretion system secreted protein VgrG